MGLNKVLVHFRLLSLVKGVPLPREAREVIEEFFLRFNLHRDSLMSWVKS